MCGITGFFSPTGFSFVEAQEILISMRNMLIHRGPDDAGNWLDEEAGIALGHRRLSILDLSPNGHQPMISTSGRYVIVFNGEIYNHLKIRSKLDSTAFFNWRGHSDTESLLAAIDHWGLERALKESVGMFSFALWDRKERILSLARDRLGEKPLYYGWHNGVFLFGSELKAIRIHPAFNSVIDRDVLPLYLRHGYIPAPWCIWRGIRKLPPGTWLSISSKHRDSELNPEVYWSYLQSALQGKQDPFLGSEKEATDTFENYLKQSIANQMLADVPVGAFLSGGIDSSTVVALMQAQSRQRVKTFTIGFSEVAYNEAVYAKAVASHLGTDHTELFVSAAQARDVIPNLPNIFDEPFGDSSSIPTFLVSQLARQSVIVSLSGDGGDEMLGGYGRYFNNSAEAIWKFGRKIPGLARRIATGILRSKVPYFANNILHRMANALNHRIDKSLVAKSALIADLIDCLSLYDYYRIVTSHWNSQSSVQTALILQYGLSAAELSQIKHPVEQMMAQDSITYLPDDILVKVDRASMAVSLEVRVPLLDHRLVELAWRMPYNLKVRDGHGKWLLRQVLYRYVPKKLIDRPKMGFGVPVSGWLRGPLREWGEEILNKRRLQQEGFLDANLVHSRWTEHQLTRNNWCDSIWLVLMWQAWLEKNK